MKAKTKVDVRTSVGLVQAPCFCQWTQHIGGMDFEFALHVAAGHTKGLVAPLAISELGTGFDTKAVVRHPKSGAPLTTANVQGLTSGDVKSVAKSALHNLIHKRVGAGRFLQAMLGAQMQLSKIDLGKYEYKGELGGPAGLATPATATISGTIEVTERNDALLDKLLGTPQCLTCDDHRVVTTTDKDHEGNNIETACPACIPKAVDDEYIPSPEEYAQAMADAETMNDNMAKYGTIDAPAGDLLHPDVVLTEADLPSLRHQREQLQLQIDQHGTMTGDTTDRDYEEATEQLAELDNMIQALERKPCAN